MNTHAQARYSVVCGCGSPKELGFSFCVDCFRSLPEELQLQLKALTRDERDTAYVLAKAILQPQWPETPPRAIALSESQLDSLFIFSRLDAKQVAVQALLDWERSEEFSQKCNTTK